MVVSSAVVHLLLKTLVEDSAQPLTDIVNK